MEVGLSLKETLMFLMEDREFLKDQAVLILRDRVFVGAHFGE